MKSERNILIAFILNLFFAIFEFIGGVLTSSVAIISDSVHDLGDAASIGLSYFFEKKSKKQPDYNYTYGYARYSVLGGIITNVILVTGSVIVLFNATERIINPCDIHKNGMIVFAIAGVAINLSAAYFTRSGSSFNEKAVNLHLLEDVLGWIAVLIGAVIIRFTNLVIIDPLMSISVSVFILYNAFKNLSEVLDLFLEKTPKGINIKEIKEHISSIDGVVDVHHIHIRSLDARLNCATMHIVTNTDSKEIKHKVKHILEHYGIHHATLELEDETEHCTDTCCRIHTRHTTPENHHHHHHH